MTREHRSGTCASIKLSLSAIKLNWCTLLQNQLYGIFLPFQISVKYIQAMKEKAHPLRPSFTLEVSNQKFYLILGKRNLHGKNFHLLLHILKSYNMICPFLLFQFLFIDVSKPINISQNDYMVNRTSSK